MKLKRSCYSAIACALAVTLPLAACTKNEASDAKDSAMTAANEAKDKATDAAADATQAANDAASGDEVGAVKANARPDECGLQEQAGPEATFGPFDGAVHFFQPGQMFKNPDATEHMLDYKDSQMHLEFDLKANEFATNWGYSVDETPADLQLVYKLEDSSGKVLATDHMMEMNAIDGSHYGTNLPKDTITKPGDYTLTITIYPPKNYHLHQDYVTGVPARGWFKPLTVAMPWKITQENLDVVKENTVENFMDPSDKCKDYPVKMYEDEASQKAMEEAEAATPVEMKH